MLTKELHQYFWICCECLWRYFMNTVVSNGFRKVKDHKYISKVSIGLEVLKLVFYDEFN